jgi:hypothetical protein
MVKTAWPALMPAGWPVKVSPSMVTAYGPAGEGAEDAPPVSGVAGEEADEAGTGAEAAAEAGWVCGAESPGAAV